MWPTVFIFMLAAWLVIAVILGVVMWRRESALQDAVLYLLAGIGGGIVLLLALYVQLAYEPKSIFQTAFIISGIILFAAATISGLRQMKALRNNKK